MIEFSQEDPGLRWVECAECKNLECAANLEVCMLCVDERELCHDCLEVHKEQNHSEEEIGKFWSEVLKGE